MKCIRYFFIVFGLCFLSSCSPVASSQKYQLSLKDQEQAQSVVREIRKSILNGDAKAFSMYISATDGLSCTDTQYSKKEANAFLENRASYFYISLFDSKRFEQKCGESGYPTEYPVISEKEFLQSANEAITLTKLDDNWIQATVDSPIKNHYTRVWYLHREGNTWKVAGSSFIIGSCVCG
jgi:hypothetical protein